MTTTAEHGASLDHRLEHSSVLWSLRIGEHGLFAALLTIGTVRAAEHTAYVVLLVVAASALAAWYAAGIWLATARRARRTGWVWLGVLVVGWLGLLAWSAEFSWVAFALFFLCVHLLCLRVALGAVVGVTAAVVAAQLLDGSGSVAPRVLGPCLGAVVAAGMALIYQRLAQESEERRRLVGQLVIVQDDLVALHDELAATQRESGAVAERARLARDIHDTLAQGFSSIVLLSRAGLAGSADAASLFTQIEATASDNLEEARRVVHALAPEALEHAALQDAIGRLLERVAEQTGIRTDLRVDGEVCETSTAHQVALLRLAQGALANVREHSGAGRVVVTLTYGSDTVGLDIVDDGRGFDPELAYSDRLGGAGFGLRAMRERLADLSGTLVVESVQGEGTVVVATIPRSGRAS